MKRLKNQNLQTIIFISATILVLILCALLPLAVLPGSNSPGTILEPEEPLPLTQAQRAALFSAYWNKEEERYQYEEMDAETLQTLDLSAAQSAVDELWNTFVIEPDTSNILEEGETCFVIKDRRGSEIRVANAWCRWTGDWQNWINLFVDIDTGEVYFFYSSGICVNKDRTYTYTLEPYVEAEELAYIWGDVNGRECIHVDWSGKVDDPATATYLAGDEVLRYQVECKYYPSTLLDVKFTVC